MSDDKNQTVLQQFRPERLYSRAAWASQLLIPRVKPRCYQEVAGTYRCDAVPLYRCVGLACDPLKGARVLSGQSRS